MCAMPSFEEGQVLAGGRYRVEKVLGRGGMGFVVAAHHLHLDERVALKFVLPERAANRETVDRFLVEARAAAKIKSEHVVRVLDAATLDDGTPYLAMEFLEGHDLESIVTRDGPLDPVRAVELMLQASEALAEAHALGIVHRDLKPANLFLTHRPDGTECIKVLDFGISKLSAPMPLGGEDSTQRELTKTAHILGSPPYMSPEQLSSSKHIDPRTDIWALGVTLHELATGERPFEGQSLPELCVAIATKPPALARGLPDKLAEVITRCLEKDPARRFASLAEMAIALLPIAPASSASVERIRRVLENANASPKRALITPNGDGEPRVHDERGGTDSIRASVIAEKIMPIEPPPKEAESPAPPPRSRLVPLVILGAVAVVISAAAAIAKHDPSPPSSSSSSAPASPPPSPCAVTTALAPSSPASSAVPMILPSTNPSGTVVARPAPSPSHSSRVDVKGLASENPFR